MKLQDFDLKDALLPSGVKVIPDYCAVFVSNLLIDCVCVREFLLPLEKLKTYKLIFSLSGKMIWGDEEVF